MLTPLWIDYISTLEGPWDASDYVDVVQELWDTVFDDIEHMVSKKNDAVHALVHIFLILYMLYILLLTIFNS